MFAFPVVMWNILPQHLYDHMMLLIDAIWMLMFKFNSEELNDAKEKVFLKHF